MGEPFSPDWLESHRVDIDDIRDEQIVGIGHVMLELRSILGRLGDPERASAMGAWLPRGMVFSGAPGTGKTLCARWLASKLSAQAQAAGGAAVPFYELSSDELSPERLRGLMRYLAEIHPRSVVYLDEIDSWAVERDFEGHSPETRLLLTAALSAFDGLVPSSGPLVIASSTRPYRSLDPALRRAGRLGFRVLFGVPDEDERVALFALFGDARPLAGPIDWQKAARLTRGHTPADIAQLVDDAAGHALVEGRDALAERDVLWAIHRNGEVVPELDSDAEVMDRLCVHEAGHVAVAVALEGPAFVAAVRLAATGGATSTGAEARNLGQVPDRELRSHVAVSYGGLAAELAIFGDATMGAESDLSGATRLLLRRVGAGLEPDFPPLDPDAFPAVSDELGEHLWRAVAGRSEELADIAAHAVLANLEPIRRFAAALAAEHELTGEPLRAAIEAAGFIRIGPASADGEPDGSAR